jgi:aryl-alcohol dehydrogenase-like predicted oxidoreductase
LEYLENAFQFLEKSRREGKIHFYGLATWNCFLVSQNDQIFLNLEDIVRIAENVAGTNHGFRAVQLPINIAMKESIQKNNQIVAGKQMTFIQAAEQLGIAVFASVPLFQGRIFTKNLPVLEKGLTAAQTCLQFVRSTPNVIPLVGHKDPAHVKENLGLLRFPLINDEKFKLSFL